MKAGSARVIHQTASFPSMTIVASTGKTAIQVNLIAQLGLGAGSPLVQQAALLQSRHPDFVDALDEPSTRLGGLEIENDRSALYSFLVGPKGHPFHAHAGPRVFTAISGSSGSQLRFSTLPLSQFVDHPERFVESLHLVDIPPDSLFTVRFAGGIWHQFTNPQPASTAPTLFALSCHPDELSGIQDSQQAALIRDNQASIPLLTETLPENVRKVVDQALLRPNALPCTQLTLQHSARPWQSRLCATVRYRLGRFRCWLARWPDAFRQDQPKHAAPAVNSQAGLAADSLLHGWRRSEHVDHDDSLECTVSDPALNGKLASEILASLLDAFIQHPPRAITALMRFRNALVMPLGLRRSRLGCPVSSLASDTAPALFAGRHRVLAASVDDQAGSAEVLLGADDRHLQFRTAVGVRRSGSQQVTFSLSTRVACNNRFGRFYMAAIRRTHQRVVSPVLLKSAISSVLGAQTANAPIQHHVSQHSTV
ncbi:MAG: DUF2867 domain-containing protein [Wenzhouxiangella sp.]